MIVDLVTYFQGNIVQAVTRAYSYWFILGESHSLTDKKNLVAEPVVISITAFSICIQFDNDYGRLLSLYPSIGDLQSVYTHFASPMLG
jgi:hypothetical protein